MTITTVPASLLPNIIQVAQGEGDSRDIAEVQATVTPMVLTFINVVAPKHPHYTFLLDKWDGHYPVRHVRVLLGKEHIGTVSVLRSYSSSIGDRYVLANAHIREERKRGTRDIRTVSLKSAVKTFNRYFRPATTQETLEPMVAKIRRTLGLAAGIKHDFTTGFTNMCLGAKHIIMEQWDAIETTAVARGLNLSGFANVLDKHQEYLVAEGLYGVHSSGQGHYVVIVGDVYYTADTRLSAVQVLASETLPTHMRTKVGMLKLMPDNTFVPGVGVRTSDKLFYVLPEAGL